MRQQAKSLTGHKQKYYIHSEADLTGYTGEKGTARAVRVKGMTREEVKKMVEMHNNKIDDFTSNILPQLLEMAGVKVVTKDNGEHEIPMNAWFKAQDFIKAMNFYKDAMEIIDMVRPLGFDVKINMQSNKLVY